MKRFLAFLPAIVLLVGAARVEARPLELVIMTGADDGVEIGDCVWHPDMSPLRIGRSDDGTVHDIGLRFRAAGLAGLDKVLFARLRFSARGGQVADSLTFTITGVLEPESAEFSDERRPSLLPRTTTSHTVTLRSAWQAGETNQLFYYSGDISPIINEIISQPGWGGAAPAVILCLDDQNPYGPASNYVMCSDLVPNRWPATLQVSRTISETLTAHEAIGRPTDRSATVNFAALVDMEAYVEYGVDSPSQFTPTVIAQADQPCDIELDGLVPHTRHVYRLCYRRAGSDEPFKVGPLRSFWTQRRAGSPFTFTVQADSHLWETWAAATPESDALKLYDRTLLNVMADAPDFHFCLGDYSMTEYSQTMRHALDHYVIQRIYLDQFTHSVPSYLVIGNHEGELGYFTAAGDSVSAWAEAARRAFVPNPYPDGFYSGCPEPPLMGEGFRESYYAWEWGDALFVVLDPYWYTMERPFHNSVPELGGGWAWTLGHEQYDWLYEVLHQTDRRWKFVFLHQLVGGVGGPNEAYGRGGIEAVKWRVEHNASYEWGGENEFGTNIFSLKRPGWEHGPIHDLLVAADVTAVIKGHDHLYAYQELDGVVYLTAPQPHDFTYDYGAMVPGEYTHGTLLPNSGHVRIRVSAVEVAIDYVRAFLPGDGENGVVADHHLIGGPAAAAPAAAAGLSLSAAPNPASAQTVVRLLGATDKASYGGVTLRIYDVAGRLCAVVPARPDGTFPWDQRDGQGRRVASGVYHGRVAYQGTDHAVRMVVVR